MIVSELISHLQTMPQDATVIYSFHSEMTVMNIDDVTYRPASEERYVLRPENTEETVFEYNARHWPPGKTPQFVGVVEFPGK